MIRFLVRIEDGDSSGARSRTWLERFRFAVKVSGDGVPVRSLVVEKWRDDSANEDDRSEGNEQLVDEHRDWVGERVGRLARGLALPEAYQEMPEVAAFLHDEGKRASRWQRAFNAPLREGAWVKTKGSYKLLIAGWLSPRVRFGYFCGQPWEVPEAVGGPSGVGVALNCLSPSFRQAVYRDTWVRCGSAVGTGAIREGDCPAL